MKKIKIVILSLLALSLISCAGAAGGGGGGGSGVTITPVNLDVGASDFYIIMQNPTGAIKNTPQEIYGNSSARSAIVQNYIRELKIQGNPVSIPVDHTKFRLNMKTQSNRTATNTTVTPEYSWDRDTDFLADVTNFRNDPTNPDNIIYHNFYAEGPVGYTNATFASNAVLKAVGEHCYVWYKAKDGIDLSSYDFQEMADKFDSIYEIETHIFGSNIPDPVNQDAVNSMCIFYPEQTKIHIIVYDLYNDYNPNFSLNTDGYFWGIDLLKNPYFYQTASGAWGILNTNECQCIHIDSGRLSLNADYTYSTLAHEFQHMLHFVNKTLNTAIDYEHIQTSETWFNEMLSMVCEDIMLNFLGLQPSDGPQSRLKLFNQTYNYGFKNWLEGDAVLISYANAYAFGAFLLRNYGIECIKEIAQSNLIDEDAILDAVQNIDSSITSFDKLLRQFADVIVYPSSTDDNIHNLNKPVSYSGVSPELTCGAINLRDTSSNLYCTLSANEIINDDSDEDGYPESNFYGAVAGHAYYGPVILNSWWLEQIRPYGTCVMHVEETQTLNTITLQDQSNNTMKYYVIADN